MLVFQRFLENQRVLVQLPSVLGRFWPSLHVGLSLFFSCHHLITRRLQRLKTAIMAFQSFKNGSNQDLSRFLRKEVR